MGRKPASGLVGLLLVGGLLTGCNKCCRQGFWGGQSIQDTPPTFGAVGDAKGTGDSWGQDPRRNTAVGDAMPTPPRNPAATQVGRGAGMPPAPSPVPYRRDVRPVGGESDGMGGVEQAGFESEMHEASPPAPSHGEGVNTEAHRPAYEGSDGMGAAEMNARQPRKLRFPPAPVSPASHEEVDEEDAGAFASSPPPPPPSPPGGSAEEVPQRAEPVGVPPDTIHSVPGGTSDPGPVPPPFSPEN